MCWARHSHSTPLLSAKSGQAQSDHADYHSSTLQLSLCMVQIGGDHKVMSADTAADCQQVVRHLTEMQPSLPLWRQHRPALHLDSAQPLFDTADPAAQGTLVLKYVDSFQAQLSCCCCCQ